MIENVILKNVINDWSSKLEYYDIQGDLILNDIINKANEYNCNVDIHISYLATDAGITKLNKHINYNHAFDEFFDKYCNNKVHYVSMVVDTNYDELVKVSFDIAYLKQ